MDKVHITKPKKHLTVSPKLWIHFFERGSPPTKHEHSSTKQLVNKSPTASLLWKYIALDPCTPEMNCLKSMLPANVCICSGATALTLSGMGCAYFLFVCFQKTSGMVTCRRGIALPGLGGCLLWNEISTCDDRKKMFVFDLELQLRLSVACYTVLLGLSNASRKQTEYSVHSPIPIDDFLGSCFRLQHLAQTEQWGTDPCWWPGRNICSYLPCWGPKLATQWQFISFIIPFWLQPFLRARAYLFFCPDWHMYHKPGHSRSLRSHWTQTGQSEHVKWSWYHWD